VAVSRRSSQTSASPRPSRNDADARLDSTPVERLRVVLSTLDLAPTVGGIQTMVAELLTRAQRTSFRVVAPADPGHHSVRFPHPVKRVRAVTPGRRGFVPTVSLVSRAELRKGDIGLAMHPLAALGFVAQSKPFVVFTHGGELRSPRIRRAAKIVFPRADRVLCNSRFTRSEAVALGADPMHCEVIPPGAPDPVHVPASEIEALRAQLGERLLLCVARLVPHKGQDALIETLTRLPGVKAVLVGRGPHESRLRALAQAKGVADRVEFVGEVSSERLPVYYAACDAFVLLSRSVSVGESAGVEGAGIAVLEAMSMELPVVAAATGGIPETVIDGTTGLLVDPTDIKAATKKIARLLEDEQLREQLTAKAKELVTGERSWRRFTERVEDALELIVRERSR
jgi:phosphatidyl-myo-inositol dimannoside synthase